MTDTAVTLGKFDGIHRGHRKLIEDVLSRKEEGKTAVLFAVDVSERLILTRQERASLLEGLGMDVLVECPLDERFKSTRAEEFVREILVGDLGASHVAVGEDFRFGYERKGTPALLIKMGEKLGFTVSVIPKEMDGHRKISSTYVREELRLGNIEKVNSLMGMPYFLQGKVIHGEGLGHIRLLPTVNQAPAQEKLLPPNGVYYTISHCGGSSYTGMTNIGMKPTVGGDKVGIETHLFHCNENLYDKDFQVDFYHFSRPEKHFPGLETLKAQLMKDKEDGEIYFEQGMY